MEKNELHLMTWKETEAAFKENPVIFVSFGSMEEHGPHSITGDYIAAYEIAKMAAVKSGNYCTPVIPFGYSEYFRGFPGTISFSPETIYNVAKDICTSLMEHGVEKIILVNGHAGNSPILDILCREIKREKGLMIGKIDLWQSLTPEFKKGLYGEENPFGHGGEPLTSVMHFLTPENMRMDLLGKVDRVNQWEDFALTNISKSKVHGVEVNMYYDMEEVTKQGVMGNPFIGNKETGERIINNLIDICVEFAAKMKNSNTKTRCKE